MPLRCLRGESEIYAFDVGTNGAWEDLRKRNRADGDLRMPCCGAGVVLRTSKLGTRHFAHARRGPCESAPETAEHLLAKIAVVDGVRRTSWAALPEQTGTTPSGAEWRADVLATRGKARVAFEIQWSRQGKDETDRRQRRYVEAGVRGLWLFRQADFPTRKEIPSFRLVLDGEKRNFDVLVPSPFYDPSWGPRAAEDPSFWGQKVPLTDFVAGALEGRLRFAPALGARMPVEVRAAFIRCWRCGKDTGVVTGLLFAASRVFPGYPDIPVSIFEMDERLPDGAAKVIEILPPALLARHGIGEVKPRRSKTAGETRLSNGCVHCGALQGRFFGHEYAFDADTVFETEAEFGADWMPGLVEARRYAYRWWFDLS